MPYFKQGILESSAKLGDLNSKAYIDAVETCRKYARELGIDKAVNDNKLDAIVAPSNAADLDDRHGQRRLRQRLRQQFVARGRRRLSEHHRSGWFC